MRYLINPLFIAASLLISGCANHRLNNAESIGATWIGATVDEVAANPAWGYPTGEEVVMGHKRVTWHYSFTDYDLQCNRVFGVGADGKIQNFQWSGLCDTDFERWARKKATP